MGDQELLEYAGPRFFGKICAGISHEIKNNLAIIGQQSGLIEDLLLMAEQGMELDAGRLKRLSEGIAQQVKRADDVVKRLNRFAHSADDACVPVDLCETLPFMIALCQRFASVKGVQLEAMLPERRLDVVTSPFLLEHLLFVCIDSAVAGSENGSRLLIRLESAGNTAALIAFLPFPTAAYGSGALYRRLSGELLRRLEGRVLTKPEAGELVIELPKALSAVDVSPEA